MTLPEFSWEDVTFVSSMMIFETDEFAFVVEGVKAVKAVGGGLLGIGSSLLSGLGMYHRSRTRICHVTYSVRKQEEISRLATRNPMKYRYFTENSSCLKWKEYAQQLAHISGLTRHVVLLKISFTCVHDHRRNQLVTPKHIVPCA
jgi:hypothetical protein